MSARVLLPGLENQDEALPKLVIEVFPAGLRGVFLTSIVAVSMSTASSALAAASSMLVQDIYEPLATVVRDSRVATFLIGAISAVMAIRFPDVVEMVFVGTAVASAPLFFPMILALFWGKANPKSAVWSMIGTVVVGMLSANLWYEKVDGVLGDVHYLLVGPLTGLVIMLGWTLFAPRPQNEPTADALADSHGWTVATGPFARGRRSCPSPASEDGSPERCAHPPLGRPVDG